MAKRGAGVDVVHEQSHASVEPLGIEEERIGVQRPPAESSRRLRDHEHALGHADGRAKVREDRADGLDRIRLHVKRADIHVIGDAEGIGRARQAPYGPGTALVDAGRVQLPNGSLRTPLRDRLAERPFGRGLDGDRTREDEVRDARERILLQQPGQQGIRLAERRLGKLDMRRPLAARCAEIGLHSPRRPEQLRVERPLHARTVPPAVAETETNVRHEAPVRQLVHGHAARQGRNDERQRDDDGDKHRRRGNQQNLYHSPHG